MKRRKPRKFWIMIAANFNSHVNLFHCKRLAKEWAFNDDQIIHVQEVLPKRRKRRAKK